MDLATFIRVILKNIPWIAMAAIFMGVLVYMGTKDEKPVYSSSTLINTGFISGYNPSRDGNATTDRTYTNAEIENLIKMAESYQTMEEISKRLLGEILTLGVKDTNLISPTNYQLISAELPGRLVKDLAGKRREYGFRKIQEWRDMDKENKVYKILYSEQEWVGIKQVKSLKVQRQGSSDVIEVTYSTSDPGICQRTLELFIEVLAEKHHDGKYKQSSGVVEYFRKATTESSTKLGYAEMRLKDFREDNNVINYYEQTRFIAKKREDIKEQYDEERMIMAAADSVVRALEREMSSRVDLGEVHGEIAAIRDSLSYLSERLVVYDQRDYDSTRSQREYEFVEREYNRLKEKVRNYNFELANIQNTPKGAEIEKILDKWLLNIIIMEETRAKIKIVKERMESFNEVYTQFAPLGSSIKKFEREINIMERDYLQNLHSLNMAILHQQSLMMSTDLTIVDKPIYPVEPDPSKRKMLIILAFLVGGILSTGVFIGLEFMDRSMKSPYLAKRETGLDVLGVLPLFPKNYMQGQTKKGKIDYAYLEERCVGLMLQQLYMDLELQNQPDGRKSILFCSMRKDEGKSLLSRLMVSRLRAYGKKVIQLRPEDNQVREDPHKDDFFYPVHSNIYSLKTVEELMGRKPRSWKNADYMVVEMPALLKDPFPVEIINQADYIAMICSANRTWTEADRKMLNKTLKGIKSDMSLVLNRAENYNLESTIGIIPKKRSFVRKFLKKMLMSS
ncbi:MAG: hypothetical protein AAFY71_13940 [Bacteroidota bacterium]